MALIGLKQLDTILTGSLQVSGSAGVTGSLSITAGEKLFTGANNNEYIQTDSTDRMRFVVGGSQMLLLDQDDGRVNIGYGQSLGVGLGNHTTPGERLEVDGNISGSGLGSFRNVYVGTHITASGNISGSSTSTGSFGHLKTVELGSTIGTLISGSITESSSSFSTRTTTLENANISGGFVAQSVLSGSGTLISGSSLSTGSFGSLRVASPQTLTIDNTGTVSGSATSTGSFGRTETTTLNLSSINGNWTNAGNTVADGGTFTTIDINGGTINGITDLAVVDGGTGVSTLTAGGVLLGRGVEPLGAMSVLADGEMIVGDGVTDPRAESGATLRTSIGVGTTDNVLFAAISASGDISGSATSTGSFGRIDTLGDIYASGRVYEAGSSVIDHATAMAIVFGG